MKKILILLSLVLALTIVAMHYHFILMDDGVKVLKKDELAFDDTFIDARGAKKIQLLKPSLLKAGVKEIIKD